MQNVLSTDTIQWILKFAFIKEIVRFIRQFERKPIVQSACNLSTDTFCAYYSLYATNDDSQVTEIVRAEIICHIITIAAIWSTDTNY